MSSVRKKIISIFLICLITLAPVANSLASQNINMESHCSDCMENTNDDLKKGNCAQADCLMSFCSFTHSTTSLFHSSGQTFKRITTSSITLGLSVTAYSSFISALLIRPPIA